MSDLGEPNSIVTVDKVQTLPICPACHVEVRPTDNFCFSCGKNLNAKPLSTSISSQFILYLKCFLLPPLGIIWGIQYLRQPDRSAKIVGLMAIAITVVILIIAVQITLNFFNTFNNQFDINNQLQNMQSL